MSTVLVAGCTSSNKEVSFKSGGMTHTFAEGKGSVPAGFPLPIYPGSSTTGSVSAEADKAVEQTKFLMLSSADPPDKVSAFYQSQLKATGWTVENLQTLPQLVSIAATKGDLEANVMVSVDVDKTTISLGVSKGVSLEASKGPSSDETYTPDKLTPPTD
ncbi:MAG: hypothetical protein HY711_10480 [Candidatus Melainabacteria bacterium]|nr:hypothetical protein [Candidatus Melainabacteria bacterium]